MRSSMKSLGLMAGTVVAFGSISAQAATITSADFTFRFGSTIKASANTWTQTENPSNSLPNVGNFTFSPAPNGRAQSGVGPKFPNGVLTDGLPGPNDGDIVGSLSNPFGDPWAFTVPVSGSYNGAAPGDAAGTPNYRLKLEITNISIYAARGPNNPSIAWEEQTSGHESTSSSVTINEVNSATRHIAANYTLVAWDPADYEIALGSLGDPFTRTFGFDFPSGTVDTTHIGDGITVQGRVSLVYDAIPEPATLSLLSLGGLALLRRRM